MKVVAEQTKDILPDDALGDYVCIDPEESKQVFDYFKGLNNEARAVANVHLHLCLHCREKVEESILASRAKKALNHILNDSGSTAETGEGDEQKTAPSKPITVKLKTRKAGI